MRARQLCRTLSFFASHGALLFLIFCCKWALCDCFCSFRRLNGRALPPHLISHSHRRSARFNISCSFAGDLRRRQGQIMTYIRRAAYSPTLCGCMHIHTLVFLRQGGNARAPAHTQISHPGRSRKLIYCFNYLYSGQRRNTPAARSDIVLLQKMDLFKAIYCDFWSNIRKMIKKIAASCLT